MNPLYDDPIFGSFIGGPESFKDRFTLYNDLCDRLLFYSRLQKGATDGKGLEETLSLLNLPREEVVAFYKQYELFSHIICFKGIAAMEGGMVDLELANRMFNDAIDAIPDGSKYAEPFFYKLVIQDLFSYSIEEQQELAKFVLANDAHALDRSEDLLARIPSTQKALGPEGLARIRGYLEA